MMRILVFLLILLASPAVHAQCVSTTRGGIRGTDVLDCMPRSELPKITALTATNDHTTYIQAAVQHACAGESRTVFFPGGRYNLSGINLSPGGPSAGIGCNGLQLTGMAGHGNRSTGAVIRATGNRQGTALRDALVYALGIQGLSISGLSFDGQNFYGDGIRCEECIRLDISFNTFTGFTGSRWTLITGVDTGTDVLTITGTITSLLTVGRRVQFYPRQYTGHACPGGLSANTPYWVVSKPTSSTFTVSTTPGGAAVNITSAGSNCYLGIDAHTYADTAWNVATDTLTLENHGWANGVKVTWDDIGGGPTLTVGISYSRSFWTCNVTEDTLQLCAVPGGSVIDIIADGSPTQQLVMSYAAVRWAGNQYCHFRGNYITQNRGGWAVTALGADADTGWEYGCNGAEFTGNRIQGSTWTEGLGWVFGGGGTWEGVVPLGGRAMLQHGGASVGHITDVYIESDAETERLIGISATGRENAQLQVTNNFIDGPGTNATGSIGIDAEEAAMAITGNEIQGFVTCIDAPRVHQFSSLIAGNNCQTTSDGVGVNDAEVGAGDDQPVAYRQSPITGVHTMQGGSLLTQHVLLTGVSTINLARGNLWVLDGTSSIATVSNFYPGHEGCARAAPAATLITLQSAAFNTLSGANRVVRNGETVCWSYEGDEGGATKPSLKEELGSVLATYDSTDRTADFGPTALFSGNITAGLYDLSGELEIVEADPTGTVTVQLAWNDGAARTRNVVNLGAASSTTVYPFSTQFRVSGSSNPTVLLDVETLTASATFRGRAAVRRIQ